MMSEEQQRRISELSNRYVDEELAAGSPFGEELTNWAVDRAIRELDLDE
jgi:hypothetical protein